MFALCVSAERVALCEARVAKLALVWFLSGVDPLVALELPSLPEAFGADRAHKVPLACVDVLVSLLRKTGNTFIKAALVNICIGYLHHIFYLEVDKKKKTR